MNHFLFVISGQDPALARAECELLLGKPTSKEDSQLLSMELNTIPSSYAKRLAFTKSIHEIILQGSPDEVKKKLQEEKQPIKGTIKIEKLAFCNMISSSETQKLLMNYFQSPQVSLDNPQNVYTLITTKEKWFVTKVVWRNNEDFEKRKNQYRPAPHPTSLHPKLARAMINLAGSNVLTILDPFCGSGGHLIEAALMQLTTKGSDIEQPMINRAQINLDYFKLKVTLETKDALRTSGTYDAIITDLPYGRNCKATELEPLYSGFLAHAKTLTKKMVISFPSIVDVNELIKESGWKTSFSCSWPLHKTLEKVLLVLSYE